MAGGIWSETNKSSIPGFFLNFVAAATSAITVGQRGTVIIPVKANWGAANTFTTIESENDIISNFTTDVSNNATAYTALLFALLGGASKILAYRLTDGTEVKATKILQDTTGTPVNVIQLTAKYAGTRGNNFKVTVQVNASDATKKDIVLYEGSTVLQTYTFTGGTVQAAVDAINNASGNVYVTATNLAAGNGTIANVSSVSFTGGTSGISGITNTQYINALTAFETQTFDVLSLDGYSDPSLHASIVAWVTRVRNEGKGIIAVLGSTYSDDTSPTAVNIATTRSGSFNYEGVVNVGVGVVFGGVNYSSAQTSPYVAGLIAGKSISESTTYATTPFDDVTRRWTRSEQELAVSGGVFLIVNDGRSVKVLTGVNSLTSLRTGQNNSWKKIRTIRTMDQINYDLLSTTESSYIGKVNNTTEGRQALIGAIKQYMQTLVNSNVIDSDFTVELDSDYYGSTATITPEADEVYIVWNAKLIDVMEQIFGKFIAQ